eukprot:scaffold85348_cov35-Tisochrysis_lutea.AAC.3
MSLLCGRDRDKVATSRHPRPNGPMANMSAVIKGAAHTRSTKLNGRALTAPSIAATMCWVGVVASWCVVDPGVWAVHRNTETLKIP